MISFVRRFVYLPAMLSFVAVPASSQDIPTDMRARIDTAIVEAYRTATVEFPCKVKAHGKADMLHWQNVDRCLNQAASRVDWEALSKQLHELQSSVYGVSEGSFAAAVEDSLTAHALSYDKVFSVKDAKARLPLTHSVLKFLPPNSLQNLPVFDNGGVQVGIFSGVFSHERSGGLSTANMYRLFYFQYTDKNGKLRSTSEALLLDSYGVPWSEAVSQPGYRLTSDKLSGKR